MSPDGRERGGASDASDPQPGGPRTVPVRSASAGRDALNHPTVWPPASPLRTWTVRGPTACAYFGHSGSEHPDPSRNTLRLNPSPKRSSLKGRDPESFRAGQRISPVIAASLDQVRIGLPHE